MDPITVQVVQNRLMIISEEMRVALVRAAYSVNIKERYDCSTAIFAPSGEVVAMPSQATVPIHLSSLDGVVKALRHQYTLDEIRPGDMFLANDPYIPGGGSSHLPDYTLVAPVMTASRQLMGYVANLGHHSDIGGAAAGSHAVHLPTIYHEGLRLPIVKLARQGGINEDVINIIALNSRLPEERRGDIKAQIAANHVGINGMLELTAKLGADVLVRSMENILDYSERRLRSKLRTLPNKTFRATDYYDDDGLNDDRLRIAIEVTKRDDTLSFDFDGTAPQVRTAVNVPMIATQATVLCVVKTLIDPELPPNAGLKRVITIHAPRGSLVNAQWPAAVGERSVTCQVVGDVLAAALGKLVRHESVAGCGSLLAYRVCGINTSDGKYFVEYQAFAGGHGATAFSDGMDSVRVWASGASNAPVEADEMAYPIRIHRYELREDSGGQGIYLGGRGIVRTFTVLADNATISTSGTRLRVPPPGAFGGMPGKPAEIVLNPGTAREKRITRMVTDLPLRRGDVVEVRTAGGGGWGNPELRQPSV